MDPRHTGRNPVSWEGADLAERPDDHNRSMSGAPQLPPEQAGAPPGGGAGDNVTASSVWAAAQAGAPKSVPLKEEQMQQTWAELMRNGAVNKPSAAMSLVDQTYLPKEYSSNLMGEGAAKGNPLGSSMHAIGLGGQGGNFNHNKVSSKFTSQFHDPYL